MIRLKPIPENIYQSFELLISSWKKDPNILFAYLFGGLAREKFNPWSDVDLALYLKDEKKLDYLATLGEIAEVLGTEEIDLIILNTAPLSLTGRILQNRKVLLDKVPFIRHQYESLTLRKFFDFSIKEKDILKRRYGIG
jgi:predicted nucleotidyltransferase